MSDVKIFMGLLIFSIFLYGGLSLFGMSDNQIDLTSTPSLSNLGTFLSFNIDNSGLPFIIPAILWVFNCTMIFIGIRALTLQGG
jgi:hypothetical protein